MNKLRIAMMLTLVLGALPACSDDNGDEIETEELDARSGPGRDRDSKDAKGPKAPESAKKDIVSIAVADGRFTTLAKALTDAKLVETLQGAGPFTVFAPTDDAFKALGQETLSKLTPEQLTTILKYHVIAADVPSSAIKAGPVKTVSGLSAFVAVDGKTVKVNDATVTTADVKGSNGVIHVIDKVLLPPNLVQAATYAGSFTTLTTAATKAGLVDALSKPDANLTVFAPTDAAFAAIQSTVAGLSTAQLTDVLKYHVVAGKVLSTDLKAGSVPTLLTGKNLTVNLTGGVKINEANVVVADVVTTNGVIHVVDKVLVPN
ncbi:MAG: fasciclin domain-containing protein [Polyangiales bacterium]